MKAIFRKYGVWIWAGTLGVALLAVQRFGDHSGIFSLVLLSTLQLTPLLYCFVSKRIDFLTVILTGNFLNYSFYRWNQLRAGQFRQVFLPQSVHEIHALLLCTTLIICTFFAVEWFFRQKEPTVGKFRQLDLSPWVLTPMVIFIAFVSVTQSHLSPTWLHMLTVLQGLILITLYCANTPRSLFIYFAQAAGALVGVYSFVMTASLTFFVQIAIIWFIQLVLERQRINLVRVFALLVMMGLLQGLKADYRDIVESNPKLSFGQRTKSILDLVQKTYFSGEVERASYEIDRGWMLATAGGVFPSRDIAYVQRDLADFSDFANAFNRVGDDSLEHVLKYTPNPVPFWNGETYKPLLYLWIPRILWKKKPVYAPWNTFGRLYGFLQPGDYQTSVGFNYLAEGYMNFGYTGLYLAAAIFGILAALIQRVSYHELASFYSFSFVALVIPLTFATDTCSMAMSLLVQLTFVLGTGLWLRRLKGVSLPTGPKGSGHPETLP